MKSSKTSIADIAHDISYHPKERVKKFTSLSSGQQVEVFVSFSPHVQQTLLEGVSIKTLLSFISHLDLGEAERVLARLKNKQRRKRIAILLQEDLKEKAEYFLRFSPRAEFNLLSFNYILMPSNATIARVAEAIDHHHKETGRFPEVLVQEKGVCVGEVPMGTLVRERNNSTLKKHVVPIVGVHYQDDVKEIRRVFKSSQKHKIVVLDTDDSVVGIIYADDVLRLFRDAPAESLYNFAGVDNAEHVSDRVLSKVENRYKWLLINLGTGFLAAYIVSLFENTINEYVLLAVYMPIVAGMGGNAATQTLAVMVRGIAMGEVNIRTIKKPLIREVGAGALNGFIVGVVVAFVASFVNHSPLFGLVIAVSMMVNLIVAGLFGALIPVVMKYFGKDPATSATIFITTATDVFGFFTFLGLATLLLV